MNIFTSHPINYLRCYFLSCVLCNPGFLPNIIAYSFLKNTAENNIISQHICNFTTILTFYLTNLQSFYPVMIEFIMLFTNTFTLQNKRIFRLSAANLNREVNTFPGGSSTNIRDKVVDTLYYLCTSIS